MTSCFNLTCLATGILAKRLNIYLFLLVDNIFTNNTTNKIISGNIVTDISDHFSQFVSVLRPKLDLKSISIYKRDYSKFSEQSFRDLYSKF